MFSKQQKNAKRPIFHIDGFGASPIYITIFDKDKYSRLLPKTLKPFIDKASKSKTLIWPPGTKRLKDISCLFETIIEKDSHNEITVKLPEGLTIETDPIHKITNDDRTRRLEYLNGYQNVYVVPYDFIHYYLLTENVFSQLKSAIEKEVNKTQLKAVLVSYSLGGNFARYFINNYSTQEWISTYIGGVQFGASGIAGAFSAPLYVANGCLFNHKSMEAEFIKHSPSSFSMFPNFNINRPIIQKSYIDSNSKVFKIEYQYPSDLFNAMKRLGKTDQSMELLYSKSLDYLKDPIRDPQIPTNFIYNSGIPTIGSLHFTISDSSIKSETMNEPGDGIIPSSGMEYVIRKWRNVTYHDFKIDDIKYDHFRMRDQSEYAVLTKKFIEKLSL